MTSVRGLEKFVELQDKIVELLNQEVQDLRNKFLSIKSILILFCTISLFSYILLCGVISFIFANAFTLFIDEAVFVLYELIWVEFILFIIRILFFILFFILFIVIISFPLRVLSLRFRNSIRWITLLQVVLFIPFYFLSLFLFLDFLGDGSIGDFDVFPFMFVIYVYLFLFVMFSWLMLFILRFTPGGFFLILTSSKLETLKSSHDSIMVRILEKTKHYISEWNKQDFEDVNYVAENKKVSITGQLQSVAIVLTTITLSGILISFISSELRESLFNLLDSLLAQVVQGFTGVEESYEGSTEIYVQSIAFIILGFIVFISYRYFSYSYTVLRAIEIIQLICHSEITKSQQQENGVLRNISLTARLLAGRFSRSDKSSKPQ